MVDALKTCDGDHKKTFIKSGLRSALNGLPVSILNGLSAIRESFEVAIVQVTTALKLLATIALVAARDTTVIAFIAL